MVTLRVARAFVQADHKLRVANAVVQGAASAPKLRVANVLIKGAVPLAIQSIPDATWEAFDRARIDVPNPSGFPTGVNFSWRQISGTPVTIADNGTYITFTCPAVLLGDTLTFGVTAHVSGSDSTEQTANIIVPPHLRWQATSTGWQPLRRRVGL